jgi:hypothetical protein
MRWGWGLLPVFLAGPAVAQTVSAPLQCTGAAQVADLPLEIRETSGLARSGLESGRFWTHNDGNSPELFAVDENGAIHRRLTITGVTLHDWEEIESAPCEGGHCLYIADIGDNDGKRPAIAIYEVLEPGAAVTEVAPRRVYTARYPDGPQDAEAMFRLPSGDMYVVSKGRQRGISLFRYRDGVAGQPGAFEHVRELGPRPSDQQDRVTAASASPNGEWVAIRTYRTLTVYRTADLLGNGAPHLRMPLDQLKQKQGEGIVLDDAGTIWSSSEAEKSKDRPSIARLSCALTRP